jgi:NAD(P)-dependent dehydrogenase (short-subunit alcohol dehydrogenase family)
MLAEWTKGDWNIPAGNYGFAIGEDAEHLGADALREDRGAPMEGLARGTPESRCLRANFASARAAFIARQPIGRLGQADEIAATAILLASDEAKFMTGSNIVIDGGMSL